MRRGLTSSIRDELIQQLQYWKTALSKVFEKHDIPQDEDGLLVQKLQVLFNTKTCNTIRSKLHQIYGAMTQTWKCTCPNHQENLLLTWHKDIKSHLTNQPAFVLSSPSTEGWVLLATQIELEKETLDPKVTPAPSPIVNSKTSKRKKIHLVLMKQNSLGVLKSPGKLRSLFLTLKPKRT